MIREQYKALPQANLEPCASYYQADTQTVQRVSLDSPAIEVMTDLKRVQVITIGPDASIVAANRAMMRNNVRSLLVSDENRCILGIITTTDILGERPMQLMRERGTRHGEVMVRDIMTPRERLEVISLTAVLTAEVGRVVATLKRSGRQHALVAEDDASGRQMIRGIFSTSQIARQLGTPIHITEIASTFAEIGAAIAH